MTDTWNAKIYSQFLDLRTRPARDLLAAIPDSYQPQTVYDLGCGPGNSTILLKQRWPHADIIGLDSSQDMLDEAKRNYPTINFIKGDIADFVPAGKIDCLFANASLQWVDHHDVLIPRLLTLLNKGGVLAVQMPNNFHLPTHQTIIAILQSNPAWLPLLKNLRYGARSEPFYALARYYDLLTMSGASSIQLWETEYCQEMTDYQEIFDWVKGTGLRPVFTAMDAENQKNFANAYVNAIATQYPLQANNKVLLPFKRIFIIGYNM